jgi:hypothetical protein
MAKKLEILTTFTGFPDGTDKSMATYGAGAIVDFADEYAALIVAKGLAREMDEKPAMKPAAGPKNTGDAS